MCLDRRQMMLGVAVVPIVQEFPKTYTYWGKIAWVSGVTKVVVSF